MFVSLQDLTASALDGDDECAAVGGPSCALEALQKRGEAIRRAPAEPAGRPDNMI